MDNKLPQGTPFDLSPNPISLDWPTAEQLEACKANIQILIDAREKAAHDPDHMVIINPDDVPLVLASILNVGIDLGRQKVLMELMVQGYRFHTA